MTMQYLLIPSQTVLEYKIRSLCDGRRTNERFQLTELISIGSEMCHLAFRLKLVELYHISVISVRPRFLQVWF